MNHRLLYIPILILFMLAFVDCAKKGTPSGGKRDTIPPVIVRSVPENYTTNFTGDEIRIYFDEYIKLDELQKNLIISPPLKNAPIITPLSTSKILKIKLKDTLRENTTYAINFGKSIVDNNEGNAFEYYKYVFSTGSYIDSLKVSGRVTNALLPLVENPSVVMLYEVNETYNDSLVFTEKPFYITTTKDSLNNFELDNLKASTYRLIALEDSNNDYIFQPKLDKIAYAESYVTVPTDTTYVLDLFKEAPAYKFGNSKHVSKHSILFGYEGAFETPKIDLKTAVYANHISTTFKDAKKDSIYYWFKPELELDSLVFNVRYQETIDTTTTRIRDLYKDTLKIRATNSGTLTTKDTLQLTANVPFVSINSEKITVTDKDTLSIPFTTVINVETNTIAINFPKTEDQKYTVTVLPGAITDFFETENDSLQYGIRTKLDSDYGTLALTIENTKSFPLIVQLITKKYEVVAQQILTKNTPVYFDEITPAIYYLRVITDTNKNSKWDTGNFLELKAPEKVLYYPSTLEVKANWNLKETFILSGNDLGLLKIEDGP